MRKWISARFYRSGAFRLMFVAVLLVSMAPVVLMTTLLPPWIGGTVFVLTTLAACVFGAWITSHPDAMD